MTITKLPKRQATRQDAFEQVRTVYLTLANRDGGRDPAVAEQLAGDVRKLWDRVDIPSLIMELAGFAAGMVDVLSNADQQDPIDWMGDLMKDDTEGTYTEAKKMTQMLTHWVSAGTKYDPSEVLPGPPCFYCGHASGIEGDVLTDPDGVEWCAACRKNEHERGHEVPPMVATPR